MIVLTFAMHKHKNVSNSSMAAIKKYSLKKLALYPVFAVINYDLIIYILGVK